MAHASGEERFLHSRLPVTAAWNPPFSAVLLDLAGCLLDSNEAHARAWEGAFRRAAAADALGGDSFSRELDGATLFVRRFARPPRPRWKRKRRRG